MPPPGLLDRRTKLTLLGLMALLLAASVWQLFFARQPGPYVTFAGRSMGTTWQVKIAREGLSADDQRRIAARIQADLDWVDDHMSTYKPDSELSRFNTSRSTEPFPVSTETARVFAIAAEVSRLSGGAFDVTVAPLVDAWGFGPPRRGDEPPDAAEIETLRERVGWQRIVVDEEHDTLRKTRPDVEADLSAIAKGYGVDRVADALEDLGYRDYLVEVGGELRARGRKLDGSPWKVAIERPSSEVREIYRVVVLEDRALATSGDYRNYYEVDGVRFSHTIDPRDGRPIRHHLASVSVVRDTCVWADAWATALDVLGPEEGYTVATKEGLAAYFIVRQADGSFTSRSTPAFEPLLETGPARGSGKGP